MVKVYYKEEIDISEYFDKHGFGDGDYRIAQEAGFDYRDTAIECIEEIAEKYGIKIDVEIDESSSMHNDCKICIYDQKTRGHKERYMHDLELEFDLNFNLVQVGGEEEDSDIGGLLLHRWPEIRELFEKRVEAIEKEKLANMVDSGIIESPETKTA